VSGGAISTATVSGGAISTVSGVAIVSDPCGARLFEGNPDGEVNPPGRGRNAPGLGARHIPLSLSPSLYPLSFLLSLPASTSACSYFCCASEGGAGQREVLDAGEAPHLRLVTIHAQPGEEEGQVHAM
jgi:hypothetical protein